MKALGHGTKNSSMAEGGISEDCMFQVHIGSDGPGSDDDPLSPGEWMGFLGLFVAVATAILGIAILAYSVFGGSSGT